MEVGSFYTYVDGAILAAVPGGPFLMGYNNYFDSKEHTVTLSDFWIYSTKVTNRMYAYCVRMGKCTVPDGRDDPSFDDPLHSNNPVVGVTWYQASEYCAFVGGRLPTEAEQEKTARGPDGNIYPWGDAAPSCDRLNNSDCIGTTTDVTQYPSGQSYYEAMDMSGNAFEWDADWYKLDYYSNAPAQDPLGPLSGVERSVRASAFNSGR